MLRRKELPTGERVNTVEIPESVFYELLSTATIALPPGDGLRCRTPGKWEARAYIDGKQVSRSFPDPERAARWKVKAERLSLLRQEIALLERDVMIQRQFIELR